VDLIEILVVEAVRRAVAACDADGVIRMPMSAQKLSFESQEDGIIMKSEADPERVGIAEIPALTACMAWIEKTMWESPGWFEKRRDEIQDKVEQGLAVEFPPPSLEG